MSISPTAAAIVSISLLSDMTHVALIPIIGNILRTFRRAFRGSFRLSTTSAIEALTSTAGKGIIVIRGIICISEMVAGGLTWSARTVGRGKTPGTPASHRSTAIVTIIVPKASGASITGCISDNSGARTERRRQPLLD